MHAYRIYTHTLYIINKVYVLNIHIYILYIIDTIYSILP